MNFDDFIDSKHRNLWIRERDLNVYVRKASRLLVSEVVPTIDVASVSVREDKKGRGVFSSFLGKVEIKAKELGRAVFVESVLESRLIPFLLKRGYTQCKLSMGTLAPSFFKFP